MPFESLWWYSGGELLGSRHPYFLSHWKPSFHLSHTLTSQAAILRFISPERVCLINDQRFSKPWKRRCWMETWKKNSQNWLLEVTANNQCAKAFVGKTPTSFLHLRNVCVNKNGQILNPQFPRSSSYSSWSTHILHQFLTFRERWEIMVSFQIWLKLQSPSRNVCMDTDKFRRTVDLLEPFTDSLGMLGT